MPMPPQTGTGFTNLQKVLQANQGVGSNLSNAINTGVTGAAQQAGNLLNEGQQQFQTGLGTEQQTETGNQAQASNILNEASTGTPSLSSQDISNYQSFGQENYGGPTGLGNFSTVQGEAKNAADLGQLTQSSGGQAQLLKQFAGSNQSPYTSGEQTLDQALLGQSGAGNLTAARQSTLGLPTKVQTTQNVDTQQAQAQQAALAQMQGNLNTQLQSNVSNVGSLGTYNPTTGTVTGGAGEIANAQQTAEQAYNTANANNQAFQQALNVYLSNPTSNSSTTQAALATLNQLGPQLMGAQNYNALLALSPYSGSSNPTGQQQVVGLNNAYQLGTPTQASADYVSPQLQAQATALAQLSGGTAPTFSTQGGAVQAEWQPTAFGGTGSPQAIGNQIISNLNNQMSPDVNNLLLPALASQGITGQNAINVINAQAQLESNNVDWNNLTPEQQLANNLFGLANSPLGNFEPLSSALAAGAGRNPAPAWETAAQDLAAIYNLEQGLGLQDSSPGSKIVGVRK